MILIPYSLHLSIEMKFESESELVHEETTYGITSSSVYNAETRIKNQRVPTPMRKKGIKLLSRLDLSDNKECGRITSRAQMAEWTHWTQVLTKLSSSSSSVYVEEHPKERGGKLQLRGIGGTKENPWAVNCKGGGVERNDQVRPSTTKYQADILQGEKRERGVERGKQTKGWGEKFVERWEKVGEKEGVRKI